MDNYYMSDMDKQQLNEIRLELEQSIVSKLEKAGIYHRSYSRVKTEDSLAGKLASGRYRTQEDEANELNTKEDGSPRKVQDIIGLRINLFFYEDINICESILEDTYMVDNWSKSERKENQFSAQKRNCVCKLPSRYVKKLSPEFWSNAVDQTFEVQLRTLLFEGWHEIEHDMRYKNQYGKAEKNALSVGTLMKDYIDNIRNDLEEEEKKLSRIMNTLIANLELCDWSLVEIYDKLADIKLIQHKWEQAIQSKYRLNMDKGNLPEEIIEYFNEHEDIVNKICSQKKNEIIEAILNEKGNGKLNINRLVYVINNHFVKDEFIEQGLLKTINLRETKEKLIADIHPLMPTCVFRQETYIPEEGFADAAQIIYEWAKVHMLSIFNQIPDTVSNGTYETIGHKLTINYDPDKLFFNMDMQHISGVEVGVVWHTTAKISMKAKGLKFVARNQTESYTPKHRPYNRPEFVRDIYNEVGFKDSGYVVREIFHAIRPTYEELSKLINNPDRKLPVVIVSRPVEKPDWAASFDGYILNIKMLRRSLGGLCHFVKAEPECLDGLKASLAGKGVNIEAGGILFYKEGEIIPQVFTMETIRNSVFEETRHVIEEESHYEKAFRYIMKEKVREEFMGQ